VRLRLGLRHATWRKNFFVRIVMFAGGVLLIIAGFLLGFVPFLPGFPLGIAGLVLLSMSSRRVRLALLRLLRRLPLRWRGRFRFLRKNGRAGRAAGRAGEGASGPRASKDAP
jgi:UPF0716 family protein affecting phage T7 exclusion